MFFDRPHFDFGTRFSPHAAVLADLTHHLPSLEFLTWNLTLTLSIGRTDDELGFCTLEAFDAPGTPRWARRIDSRCCSHA